MRHNMNSSHHSGHHHSGHNHPVQVVKPNNHHPPVRSVSKPLAWTIPKGTKEVTNQLTKVRFP